MFDRAAVNGGQVTALKSSHENEIERNLSREDKMLTTEKEAPVFVEEPESPWQDPNYFKGKWDEVLFVLSCMMGQLFFFS